MKITEEHFGKKMVITKWFRAAQYFVPHSISSGGWRVHGTTHYPDGGTLGDWWSNEEGWTFYVEPATSEGFRLTEEHIGKKVRLPIWDGRTNILYFVPSSSCQEDRRIPGVTHYTDGSYRDDQWYNQSGWTLYDEPKAASTGVEQKASSVLSPKDYSLLEAIESGRNFRPIEDDESGWLRADAAGQVHFCDSYFPVFVITKYLLKARYELEPGPKGPVLFTDELFESAWRAAQAARSDHPFKGHLKEALKKALDVVG